MWLTHVRAVCVFCVHAYRKRDLARYFLSNLNWRPTISQFGHLKDRSSLQSDRSPMRLQDYHPFGTLGWSMDFSQAQSHVR